MIERITNGWSVIRVIYLLLGSAVIAQGIMEKQWFAVAFGVYFASMGVFNYGCASGACYTSSTNRQETEANPSTQDIQFEEVKNK